MPSDPPSEQLRANFQRVASLYDLEEIRLFIEQHAKAYGLEEQAIFDLSLAVDEAATNILEHGYHEQPGPLEIEISRNEKTVRVTLRDRALPFDPTRAPDANLDLPLEQRPLGGMGIFLMRRLLDRISHRLLPEGGNELILEKNLS